LPKSKLTSGERLRRKGAGEQASRAEKSRISNLIIVGASAGGYKALSEIFRDLPADIPAAIVVILHMPLESDHQFAASLGRFTRIPIIAVEKSEPLRQGTVFVPPAGRSLNFRDETIEVGTIATPARPVTTINRSFAAAAKVYGQRVIGVILSGLLRDGTDGLRAVHNAGGLTIVQDPREAEYPDMPASAMKDLPVTFRLNLSEIGPALELLVRRDTEFETGLAVAVRTLRKRVDLLVRLGEQSGGNPGTHEFLVKELASLRHDLQSIDGLMQRVLVEDVRLRKRDRRN
jgi:two-component system chemotaxis response regulator CheB